ncbi:hypothetical protein MBLNU13_g11257t2 [Cladosporium sp. NU13]
MIDFKDMLHLRPAEINTYHNKTYDRISPSKTSFNATGKTLLITAGATGIGYSISESFAKAGIAQIIILQRRQSVLDAAKEAIEKAYPDTKVVTYVASQADFERVSKIIKSVGEIDVLVTCAASSGGCSEMKLAKDTRTEDMAEIFNTNVVGLHHLIHEFLAQTSTGSTASSPRSVIHVSSNGTQMYHPGGSGYSSSNPAATRLVTHFAVEQPGESNVKFYSFHPGAIKSALSEENVGNLEIAFEDVKLPGDFAVWLASPEAEFLNGRFVWAEWDVDELIAMRGKVASDQNLLTVSIAL